MLQTPPHPVDRREIPTLFDVIICAHNLCHELGLLSPPLPLSPQLKRGKDRLLKAKCLNQTPIGYVGARRQGDAGEETVSAYSDLLMQGGELDDTARANNGRGRHARADLARGRRPYHIKAEALGTNAELKGRRIVWYHCQVRGLHPPPLTHAHRKADLFGRPPWLPCTLPHNPPSPLPPFTTTTSSSSSGFEEETSAVAEVI